MIFSCCTVKFDDQKVLPEISTLKSISFNKCDGEFYKLFTNQNSVEKITIINEDQTFDGFSHEDFNELMKKLKNVKHLVLKGTGTVSYFDYGCYSFSIEKLETDFIACSSRTTEDHKLKFLESQKESLKELTIENLPNDFIGGKILKYIIENTNLLRFCYGKICLIDKGKKQNVDKVSANENQISCIIELLRHYPGKQNN